MLATVLIPNFILLTLLLQSSRLQDSGRYALQNLANFLPNRILDFKAFRASREARGTDSAYVSKKKSEPFASVAQGN